MNLRDWKLRARALFAPRRVERELDDELAFHIERETAEARRRRHVRGRGAGQALARFGPVPLAADECRDARGTAFVDDTVRDVLYALRRFRRAPLVAFTIVSTVALGLGLVAVAFTLLNALLFRVDQVPDVHEMYAVERPRTAGGERQPFHARAVRRAPARDRRLHRRLRGSSPTSTAGSTDAGCSARSSRATSSRCSASTPRSDAR